MHLAIDKTILLHTVKKFSANKWLFARTMNIQHDHLHFRLWLWLFWLFNNGRSHFFNHFHLLFRRIKCRRHELFFNHLLHWLFDFRRLNCYIFNIVFHRDKRRDFLSFFFYRRLFFCHTSKQRICLKLTIKRIFHPKVWFFAIFTDDFEIVFRGRSETALLLNRIFISLVNIQLTKWLVAKFCFAFFLTAPQTMKQQCRDG